MTIAVDLGRKATKQINKITTTICASFRVQTRIPRIVEQQRLSGACANPQSRQNLRCLHTQSVGVDFEHI